MNKANLISQLKFVSDKQPGLELYFLYKGSHEAPIEILRADLEDNGAKERLQSVFITKIKNQLLNQNNEGKSIDGFADWFLKPIGKVDEIKNTYYFFPVTPPTEEDDYHIPEEFEEMKKLWNLCYEDVPKFNFKSNSLENVFAFLIRLQVDNEQVIIYKHKYPIDVLSKTPVLKALGFEKIHATRFSLEKEPLLKVSDKIDFMLVNKHFIILNLNLLESKYGFNDRYLRKGAESLELIRKKNILTNLEVFEKQIQKLAFSKKLMKVKTDNEVLKQPIQTMKKFLEDYKTKDGKNSLAKRIKYVPGKGKFEIKTMVAAEDFVRLLNDQYLFSQLTQRPFISNVQEEFTIEEEKTTTENKINIQKQKA